MIFETKAALSVDDEGLIEGLAWPFGTPDRVGDMITKGAFAGTALPVPMLDSHDPRKVIGVWTHVEEIDEGLTVKGRLLIDDVPDARRVNALVKAGALGGLSIGFSTKKQMVRKANTATRDRGGRTITALELVEISLVSIPSHPGARLRQRKSVATAIRNAEAIQRAALALTRSSERTATA